MGLVTKSSLVRVRFFFENQGVKILRRVLNLEFYAKDEGCCSIHIKHLIRAPINWNQYIEVDSP